MILIVDSGSTKSDWILVRGEERTLYKTMGFNPYFHSETIIANAIKQNQDLCAFADEITNVYYYGAGCSSEALNSIVSRALHKIFMNAEILVDHDLLACAYATYKGKPAISCILGTGSNSCHFDGERLTEEVPALAYILGDEGSGSYFGKKLLSSYLYKHLPKEISDDLEATFKLDKDSIIDNVYMKPHANVFLASFMRFIAKHKEHPFIDQMIYEGLREFIRIHVKCFSDYAEVEVNFIGSIGYFFADQLSRAAKDEGITLGTVTRKPIDGLVDYHLREIVH